MAGSPANIKPKVIVGGGSAIRGTGTSRRFREIADEVGAYFFVDMAHFAGLVAGGAHPSPFPHAHVVTSTTHKTLRGPRGGMVLTNDEAIAKKINSAVFPGLQGGPLMHVIAAKAVAFGEALRPDFRAYAHARWSTTRARWLRRLKSRAAARSSASGGTDNHLMLVDLRPKGHHRQGRRKLRLGARTSPATRMACLSIPRVRWSHPAFAWARRRRPRAGSAPSEFKKVGELIAEVLDGLAKPMATPAMARSKQMCASASARRRSRSRFTEGPRASWLTFAGIARREARGPVSA